ncbi:LysE family translocator [Bacillus sp. 03113]|uniref:LysE family translocator n=1 Tax=Bacillus sp. 03113 TaxID=2578211 RepID=UPI0011412432|nr:LysE family transporter [Bacillus sp. 03113]
MDFIYLLKGLILGFSIAAPVGPIGLLCIRRTLAQGQIYGVVSGIGVAAADALYGLIAGYGLTFISNFLIEQQFWLRLGGGIFLCYFGFKIFRSKASAQSVSNDRKSIFDAFTSIFFLTMTNPMTILSFIGIFAGLGISNSQVNHFTPSILVLGVFFGSALWWILLCSVVSLIQKHLNTAMLLWINRLSGLIIFVFGVTSLYSIVLSI